MFPGEVVEFSVQRKIERGEPSWANYSRGVAAELIAAGIPLSGMDALMHNTLPVGGGLSSSAAIEVATAQAFLLLAGLKMDPVRLALICQRAEHEFAGVPVGIMDQMIVASGMPGHAMLLDCRDLSKQFVPIDPNELRVMIVNSMVRHELSSGEYAQRRRQCEQGVAHFRRDNPQIKALRDVNMTQVESAKDRLDDVVYRRCRHVVGENKRTTEAAALLGQKHYEQVGELMVQSHNSLRDDYEVSCEELDYLVEQAMTVKGVYGARMTGGGFGGCIVALVQPRSIQLFTDHIAAAYRERFGIKPSIFATDATAGVTVLE
jgi:galactokinase